jgi:nifR3 family TIM-barrel protein
MEQHSAPQTALRIGEVTLRHGLFLAPLAGVSDHPFRAICRRFGAEYTVSEMVSAQSLCYERMSKKASVGENSRTAPLACVHADDVPMAVQLFGRDPHFLSEAAKMIEDGSYAGCKSQAAPAAIDLNMGCPVPKIVKNGDGSALMKNLPLAEQVIRAAVAAAGDTPLTVKFRLGFESDVSGEFALMCQDAGAAAVCLHARTRSQMYSGNADWSAIGRVKTMLSIPLIGNGDIFTPEDALAMFETTGCDHVMVARGALGNPQIFSQIKQLRETGRYDLPTPAEKLQTARRIAETMFLYKPEVLAAAEAKKQVVWCIKGMRHSAKYKNTIFASRNGEELFAVLAEYEKEVLEHE